MPKMRLGYCRPGASPLKRMTASWCGSLADPPGKPGEFHPELLTGRVENWRAGLANTFRPRHVSSSLHVGRVEDWRAGFGRDASRPSYVSSPRHIERNMRLCRVGPGSFTPSRSQIRT